MIMKKIIIIILTFVLCIALAAHAAAGTSISENRNTGTSPAGGSLADQLRQVPEFRFYHCPNGIGYDACPVYTAPSEHSFRMANGKATVSTDHEMYDGGFDAGWLMVRYETNDGDTRVGYIPPGYIRGYQSVWGTRRFSYIPVTAAQTIRVTNNPLLRGSGFAYLDPGECFHILAKYTYHPDWWYIECTVDGQLARGFIDRDSSGFYLGDLSSANPSEDPDWGRLISFATLGSPSVSPLGTSQVGVAEVAYGPYGRKTVYQNPDSGSREIAYLDTGTRCPCYEVRTGASGEWYYIWIEGISRWGWIPSGSAVFMNGGF